MSEIRIERNIGVKRRGLSPYKLAAIAAVLVSLALLALKAPFLEIKFIEVSGNDAVSAEALIDDLGVNGTGANYFLFSEKAAAKALMKNSYIKTAIVTKSFPNSVYAEVTERIPRCYVEYKNMSMYLLIDESGMVMDVHAYMREKLPIIVGVNFSSFTVGEYLETDSEENFNNVVLISVIFAKYELDDVLRIDVSDSDDIRLFVRGIEVTFGSLDDGDEKVRILKAALEKFEELGIDSRGFLDISDVKADPVFRYLK